MIDSHGEEAAVLFIQYECDSDGHRSFRDRSLNLYRWKDVEVVKQAYNLMMSTDPRAAEEQCLNVLVNKNPGTINRLSKAVHPTSWRCVLSEFMTLTENIRCP